MDKQVRSRGFRQRTTLFFRIILRLVIPLTFLGLIFAGIQLTSQIKVLNEFHSIRGQIAFDNVKQQLGTALTRIRQGESNKEELPKLLRTLEESFSIQPIHAYDMLSRTTLFGNNTMHWSPFDIQNIDESLYQKQHGRSFIIKVDRLNQSLFTYIPLTGFNEDQIIIFKTGISLTNIEEAVATSKWQLLMTLLVILIIGIFISRSLSVAIIKPIASLKKSAQRIVMGELDNHVEIKTGDEIEVLAHTFNHMVDKIKLMTKQAQDANPLTQLPGNQGIYHEITTRIHEQGKFVFMHVDIDRFKLFNDHFGLARGDEVIKQTANVLKRALKEKGCSSDFVGHQGGDDYVIICLPQHAQALGDHVCKLFDEVVRGAVYRKDDLDRGHTLQLDRRRMAETGEKITREFPLISISLAGISNASKDFSDYFTCMAASVDVKKEVKDCIESICIIKNH